MNFTRTRAALSFTALAVAVAAAYSRGAQPQGLPQAPASSPAQVPQPSIRPQQPAPPSAPVRPVIFLDPAHGGPETGASLSNNIPEKDVTLAFVQHLRPALASAGFNVVTTRESDLPAALPTDQRAETANRSHALACIVVHATGTGTGVHLYTSSLQSAPFPNDSVGDTTTPFTPIPWESAQAGFVEQSRKLSDLLKATLAKSGLPVIAGSAPLRPLDSLMCPAVAIEIAPNSASISASDSTYQQQLVVALASAFQLWRNQNTPSGGPQ